MRYSPSFLGRVKIGEINCPGTKETSSITFISNNFLISISIICSSCWLNAWNGNFVCTGTSFSNSIWQWRAISKTSGSDVKFLQFSSNFLSLPASNFSTSSCAPFWSFLNSTQQFLVVSSWSETHKMTLGVYCSFLWNGLERPCHAHGPYPSIQLVC